MNSLLLVEDSPDDAFFTEEALRGFQPKIELKVLSNGADAMMLLRRQGQYSQEQRPTAVLLDLHMPRKDGFEVLREAKRDPELKNIPIIVLTSSDLDKEILRDSYNLRPDAFVKKPVQLETLVPILKELAAKFENKSRARA